MPVGHNCAGSPNPEEHVSDEHIFLVASVQAAGHVLMVDDERPLPGEGLHAQGISAPGWQSTGASSVSADQAAVHHMP